MSIMVTMKDVYSRDNTLKGLTEQNILSNNLYDTAMSSTSSTIIENAIVNWRQLDRNEFSALTKVVDILEHAFEVCTDSQCVKYANMIAENAVPKIRNGAQTADYFKRKLGRFKTKLTTKIIKKTEKTRDAAIQKLPKPVEIKNDVKAPTTGGDQQASTEETCMEILYNKALIMEQCDRVINNDRKLSKRYNLDKIAYYAESVEDFVFEMGRLLDTYDMPYYAKYSIAIENSMYTLYKNHLPYEPSEVVEAATTYSLMKDIDSDYISGLSKILIENNFIPDDLEYMDYMLHPEPVSETFDNIIDTLSYSASIDYLIESNSNKKIASSIKKKKEDVKNLIDKYKLTPEKTIAGLNALVTRIFTKTESEVVDGIPGFFTILRNFFVLGSFGINPVLGVLTAFTNHLLGMHYNRKSLPAMKAKYEAEIKKVEKKMEKAKGEEKDRLDKYLHGLKEGRDEIEKQYDELRTEKERDADFGMDDDLDEAALLELAIDLQLLCNLAESIDISVLEGFSPDTVKMVSANTDIVEAYAECSSYLVEDQRLRDSIHSALEDEYTRMRTSTHPIKYTMTEYARLAKQAFESNSIMSSNDNLNYNINRLFSMYELCESVSDIKEYQNGVFLEADTSITNKLKLAGEKLVKTAQNLSDKEKMMSKTIDGSMASLRKGIEKSLTVDNREAIIKGQIIPPASKIIKMAITGGIAWMVNPAVAVIGAIGAFAASKKIQKKERQLLLDEINIELEMVEKYLKIAENKDDMKATRELLQIQKRLQREKSRITHMAKYSYNSNVDTSTSDRD